MANRKKHRRIEQPAPAQQGANDTSTSRPEIISAWKAPTVYISSLALLVSVSSLLTSMRSCDISRETAEMRRAEYEYARQIVLLGTIERAENVTDMVKISPSDPALALQRLTMILPAGFRAEESDLTADFTIRGHDLRVDLGGDKPLEWYRSHPGYFEIDVPVVLDTQYTLKGEVLRTVGLYEVHLLNYLDSEWVVYFRFVRHLVEGEDVRSIVNSLWNPSQFTWHLSP